MNPIPLNVSVLQNNGYLRLDASRKHLISQTGKTIAKWDTIAGKAGKIGNVSLVRKLTFGGVAIAYSGTWITFESAAHGKWGVNTTRFADTPKLKVTVAPGNSAITIALTGARFPGLDISANLTAKLFLENGVAMMDLEFAFCGFAARVGLADWLDQKVQAIAPVLLDDSLCRITTDFKLSVAGTALASFGPAWLFLFGSQTPAPFVSLLTQGKTIESNILALALLAPGMPSAIPGHADRRSFLFIPESKGFDLPLWPEHNASWQFDRNPVFLPFNWLGIEADEQASNGLKRRAVVAIGQPTDFVFFRPAGERLKNDLMEPFVIPLHRPIYAALYLGDGTRLGAALVAQRGTEPLTVHTSHCSLALGPLPRKPGFLLFQNDVTGKTYLGPLPNVSGVVLPGLQFMLLASAQRPTTDAEGKVSTEGLVVDPTPPLVPNVITLTIEPLARPLHPLEGEIHVPAPSEAVRLTLPNFLWTQLVRPRDMMVLGFQFLGLRPEFIGDAPGRLVKASFKDVPRIIVYFPPQNITEMAAYQDESCKSETLADPYLNNFPFIAPHRAAGLSRLVFDLPQGANDAPFTLQQLLDWSGGTLRPRLDNRALSPLTAPDISEHIVYVAPRAFEAAKLLHGHFKPANEIAVSEVPGPIMAEFPPQPPALDVTAIEAPYRLLISPDQFSKWENTISSAMASGARSVLWHTRLEPKTGDGTPLIRALYAVDDIAGVGQAPLEHEPYANTPEELNYPPTSLKLDDRQKLVTNSVKKAVDAKRLMLTAMGAWLDLDGSWSEFPGTTLIKWEHRATLGRDQFVKVVRRGYGFPFGHRLVEIKITERQFGQHPKGRVGAWMRQRVFYVVMEPERTYLLGDNTSPAYSAQSKEIPFRKVRIVTKTTPLIDPTSDTIEPSPAIPAGKPKARWLEVLGKDFLFHFVAEDREGNPIEFSAPMAFVPHDDGVNGVGEQCVLANTQGAINSQLAAPSIRRSYVFNGQKISYTECADGKSALETDSLIFTATIDQVWKKDTESPPFFPKILTAKVSVAALRQFAATGELQTIRYAQTYLNNGYSGPNANGQVFAQIDGGSSIEYGNGNRTDKVGGLAPPGMTAGGLSRSHGVVGTSGSDAAGIASTLASFADGKFKPGEYFGALSAKLLGGITLIDILKATIPFDTASVAVPRWITTREGDDIVNRLTWETSDLEEAFFFQPEAGAKLKLTNEIRVRASDPANASSVSSAELTNFNLNLVELIKIPFERFAMTTVAGRKPEVDVRLGDIEFMGALKFLKEIQDKLQLDKFSDPPNLDVTQDGLTVGYTLQIPSIQVGVFALRNLALSAQATLPFNGDPFRTRFAISERQSPFQIAVSLFTGGGFFSLSLGLDGVEGMEIMLEFGGSFSLDIGVASGGVYVMAGLYFKSEADKASLTGYVRAGGSMCVLGLITVSVEFYLGLTYQDSAGSVKVWGEASMTVEITILFFSADVTLTVRREFAGDASDPTLADTHTAEEWDNDYIAAFAS